MAFNAFLTGLEGQAFSVAIRDGASLFPWLESLHVLAVALVVGTIWIVDLRLIGLPAHIVSARRLIAQVLPYTWGAFALAVATGFLMFASNAVNYGHNTPFLIKMGLLVLAGVNMGLFHVLTAKSIADWDVAPRTPPVAKIFGAASLLLWTTIVVVGRWIGFV